MKYAPYVKARKMHDGSVGLANYDPNEWDVIRDVDTLTILERGEAGLIIWQTTDKGQSHTEAICEAIASTVVLDWEDESAAIKEFEAEAE